MVMLVVALRFLLTLQLAVVAGELNLMAVIAAVPVVVVATRVAVAVVELRDKALLAALLDHPVEVEEAVQVA
jgi:hypothetical protein